MSGILTAAELREIEERTAEMLTHFQEARLYRQDVPRLVATVKALRTLLHGVAWNDAAIDMALGALGPGQEAGR